jgi:hypothetical protein
VRVECCGDGRAAHRATRIQWRAKNARPQGAESAGTVAAGGCFTGGRRVQVRGGGWMQREWCEQSSASAEVRECPENVRWAAVLGRGCGVKGT